MSHMAIAQTAETLIEEHLRAGRQLRFTISTTSMWPSLSPGDEVLVRATGADSLRPGDIVLSRSGNAWRAHRLLARLASGSEMLLVTKGDNSPSRDEGWPAGQALGVVSAVRRGGREVNLETRQARWAGAALALISRYQSDISRRAWPDLPRRAALKGLRLALRLGAAAAQWMNWL